MYKQKIQTYLNRQILTSFHYKLINEKDTK